MVVSGTPVLPPALEEAGVVASYGDATAEYRAVRDAAGVAMRDDLAHLVLTGRDPVRMIQGLVTNDVAGAPDDRVTYAVLLTPKGRMLGEMRVLRREDDVLMDVDAAALDGVLAHLKKFVPPLFARFEKADIAVVGVYGPRAYDILCSVCDAPASALAEDEGATCAFGVDVAYMIGSAWTGGAGADVLIPVQHVDALRDALVEKGAHAAGHAALDVLRIEAGVPRWGAELDETTIPLEAELGERAISTTKGCYTGQEVIIRILHRGHVNWHLRGLRLGDVPVPPRGETLTRPDADKTVARITSACVSPRFDQTIALGYARREVEPPAGLLLGETKSPAQVVTLPFTE